jgi:hypothetical protein
MDQSETPKDASELFTQVSDRHKWLRDNWLNEAEKIQAIYQGDKADETPFNILYSNTEILVPAIFSRVPTPVVKRRHDATSQDLPAKAAERFLEYAMDTNLPGYPAFIDALESSILDAALPGLGQARVRLVEGVPQVDYVHFDSFVWGYARRWEAVPWIAYRHDLSAQDLKTKFALTPEQMEGFAETPPVDGSDEAAQSATYPVYEVWDKRTKTVSFVCEQYQGALLAKQEDQLNLHGFYDCPQPLVFVLATGDIKPRPLYSLYRKQAEELNAITARIKRVTQAIRVRGIYNGNLPEMAQIFSGADAENALIPAERPSVLTTDGGLDKQIWLVPVDKLVQVLQQLLLLREQVKSTIYEILGIGDILRGVSRASETLGAQEIKDKWGSLRINKMRDKTARFIRSLLRLLVEVGAKHSPEEVWAAATGLPLLPTLQAQVIQQSGGQLPAPPWKGVLDTLKNDLQRSYTVDIETNTTVDSEATQDKQDVAEFMNALGQAMSGLAPLASLGPEGFEATKAIVLEFTKKFRMGADVQAVLEKLKPPPAAQGPDPKVMEELKKRTEDVGKREQGVQQQEQGLASEKAKLEQSLAKLENIFKDIQIATQQLELAKKTALREIELDALEKGLALEKQVLGVKELGLGVKSQEVGLSVREAKGKMAEATETQEVSAKEASQIAGVMSEMVGYLGKLGEATQAAVQAVTQAAKPRGKARFVQQDDGSVVKEYID